MLHLVKAVSEFSNKSDELRSPSTGVAPSHLVIGRKRIAPGQTERVELPVARLSTQTVLSLPVTVVNGAQPGPHLWLSAAVHGDEVNGVEIIRRVLQGLNSNHLKGAIIAAPIVNMFGFIHQSRYLPDRRDLNRSFPGNAHGSLAGRLAHLFMKEIVSHCQYGIDLHTASHHRTNYPQIRANLHDPLTYQCAQAFGAPILVHAVSRDGSLRQAAAQNGIPVLLYEGGEALRFDEASIQIGVQGIQRVMAWLDMYTPASSPTPDILESYETRWIRAPRSGILHLIASLGEWVSQEQPLGWITDAFGERRTQVYSRYDGLVIGHYQNPLVNQGDGLFHIALVESQLLKT